MPAVGERNARAGTTKIASGLLNVQSGLLRALFERQLIRESPVRAPREGATANALLIDKCYRDYRHSIRERTHLRG